MNNLIKKSLGLSSKLEITVRNVQTNASLLEEGNEVRNRNPRNLELMRIAKKPAGYHLEKPGKDHWNRLVINRTKRHVFAEIHHFKHGPVITATTEEWALKKQLYKSCDVAAYKNVGRLLAQRALESGITAVYCDIDPSASQKKTALLDALKENGLELTEPPQYRHANPWDSFRDVKPWTVQE
ncbi:hypothetical protein QAD02_016659 [Eretmocerus hayati]|uniref:Uncharacterized protein n=1 Tax=Eretmocerus hayati TaxID=131215 RepID=A0ACC2PC34_9HYME|nr:hypothetical protein QAD02_016659 [Eretmocerus hayati]